MKDAIDKAIRDGRVSANDTVTVAMLQSFNAPAPATAPADGSAPAGAPAAAPPAPNA